MYKIIAFRYLNQSQDNMLQSSILSRVISMKVIDKSHLNLQIILTMSTIRNTSLYNNHQRDMLQISLNRF